MILEQYREQARRAFYATSFDPDKRGDRIIADFSAELEDDLLGLPEDKREKYQSMYTNHFLHWLSSESRCMSSAITGPSNFPAARANKHRHWAESAYNTFRDFRKRFFSAVNRVHTLSPEDDLDLALKDLDSAVYRQEFMKAVNKIVRSNLSREEKIKKILADEWKCPEDMTDDVLAGFESFQLTNNNARIKRLEEKVLTMKARIARKESFQPISFEGGEITIEADRVIIKHDSKPEQSVIDNLKGNGFHWSRNYGSWSRKHTGNAIIAAKRVCGIPL